MHGFRWVIPVVLMLAVSACSSQGGATGESVSEDGAPAYLPAPGQIAMTTDGEEFVQAEPSPEQTAALEDGVVTREEYEAGFSRFESCMERIGIELVGAVVSADIISYSYLPQGTVAEENCYYAEFDHVSGAWQMENGDREGDLAFLGGCLEKYGIRSEADPAAKPSRQVEAMEKQIADAGIDLETCPLPSF